MVVTNSKIGGDKKYTSNAGDFDDHAHTAVRCGAHRPMEHILWLYAKPLDVAIGRVPALYCPDNRNGRQFQMKQKKTLTKHNCYLAFLR
jgi:hypothetical protein